jgi:hypothetical protein
MLSPLSTVLPVEAQTSMSAGRCSQAVQPASALHRVRHSIFIERILDETRSRTKVIGSSFLVPVQASLLPLRPGAASDG